jgi:hypothetical protein
MSAPAIMRAKSVEIGSRIKRSAGGEAQTLTQAAEGKAADEIVALTKSECVDMLFLGNPSRAMSDERSCTMGDFLASTMWLAVLDWRKQTLRPGRPSQFKNCLQLA